jgi:hypothetical protein
VTDDDLDEDAPELEDDPEAGKAKGRRRTREEQEQVDQLVWKLLAAGFSGRRLDEQLAQQTGMDERTARRYRSKAEKAMKKAGSSATAEMLGLVFQRALAGGKHSAAVSAVNALAKLKPADPSTLEMYKNLGEPPADTLQALDYLVKGLLAQHREIMLDTTLEPRARRAELRANANSVLRCIPRHRLMKAHQIVSAFAEGKQDPSKGKETEDVEDKQGGSLRADARRGARFPGRSSR